MAKPIQVNGYSLVRTANEIIVHDIRNGTEATMTLVPPDDIVGKLNIQLSNICNMRCGYCSEGAYNKHDKQEVCIEDAQAVITAYLKHVISLPWAIHTVRLSFDYGGEPFCQLSRMVNIVGFFRKECAQKGITPLVQVTTNGVWSAGNLDIIRSFVDECIISIDGPRELHEKYRVPARGESVFDLIVNNAHNIYELGKLYQLSAVVTQNTIAHIPEFTSFFVDEFPNATVRIRPVMVMGEALEHGVQKIPLKVWREFVSEVRRLSGNRLRIIDTKPEKSLRTLYQYGCEYMNAASWFYWLDGNISCCSERESTQYRIGRCEFGRIEIDEDALVQLRSENNIEVLPQCSDCLAKYYCAGGCSKLRTQINCDIRRMKYAKLLIKQIKE